MRLLIDRIAVLCTDAAYRPSSVVYRSVCRSVTLVILTEITKPIKISFGMWTRVSLRNRALDEYPDALIRRGTTL